MMFTGAYLPDLCKAQRTMPRRAMSQLLSSNAASSPTSAIAAYPVSAAAAASPESSELYTSFSWAPVPVPAYI